MANEVKILINAVDNTGKAMGSLFGGFTELSSAIGLLERGLGYVDKAFDATIGVFSNYATQVEDLSRITGMSADETSRLIQVADDLFVEYGTLTTATRILASQGIVPTIDKMAELSDQYLSFTDKNEQATWAVKTFGRQYAEITKLLEVGGQAIKEAAAGQPGGLILDEQDLENARAYKQSLDALNDTFAAIATTIGSLAVPVLTNFLNMTYRLIAASQEQNAGYKLINDYLVSLVTHETDYATARERLSKEINSAMVAERSELKITQEQAVALYALFDATWKSTTAKVLATSTSQYATIGFDAETDAIERQKERIEATNEAYEVTKQSQDDLAASLAAGTYSVMQYDAAHGLLVETLTEEEKAAIDAANAMKKDLAGAIDELNDATKNWALDVGNQFISAVEGTKGMTEQEKGLAFAIIDQITGTNKAAAEQMEKDIQRAIDKFNITGNQEQFGEDIKKVQDTFDTVFATAIDDAKKKVDELQTKLAALTETPIDVQVNINVNYPNGPIPTVKTTTTNPITTTEPDEEEIIPDRTPKFRGGSETIINVYPATVSAAHAAMAAAIAQARNASINTRMTVGAG